MSLKYSKQEVIIVLVGMILTEIIDYLAKVKKLCCIDLEWIKWHFSALAAEKAK